MGEQAQRHKKIEDNPQYQNRERDQRGEDHDVWRIAGGIGHGVIRRTWTISVRGASTTPVPKSIWFRSTIFNLSLVSRLSPVSRLRHCLEAGIENKSALMEGFL